MWSRSAAPATQNDDGDLQNAATATKTATDLAQTTQKYCACHTKRFSTRYQTGWNVTKWRACHAKTTLQPVWDVFLRVFLGTSKICYLKIDVSCEASVSTSHKMPRLPRNLHLVATWHSPDNAIRKKHATRHVWSAASAAQNHDGHVRSAAPSTNTATHLAKTSQNYCACYTKRLSTPGLPPKMNTPRVKREHLLCIREKQNKSASFLWCHDWCLFDFFLSELGFRIQHFHTLSLCLECIAEDSFHSVIVVWETRFCFTLFCALYHYLSLILVFS